MRNSKSIAFTMASVMALSMLPVFNVEASTESKLSNGTLSIAEKTMFYEPGLSSVPAVGSNYRVQRVTEGNYIEFKAQDDIATNAAFEISIENGKFAFQDWGNYVQSSPLRSDLGKLDGNSYTRNNVDNIKMDGTDRSYREDYSEYTMTATSEDTVKVTTNEKIFEGETIRVPMIVRASESSTSGTVKAYINGRNGFSTNQFSLATISSTGSTTVTVENVKTGKNRMEVEKITIKENVAGTMRPANGDGFYIELPSGYYFTGTPSISGTNVRWDRYDSDLTNGSRKLLVRFTGFNGDGSGLPGRVIITGLVIVPNSTSDTLQSGVEEIKATIDNSGSSKMVSYQDFLIGNRADYGVSFKTDTVPTLLSGYYDTSSRTNTRTKSAKLTISEQTVGSLINGGDLTLSVKTKDSDGNFTDHVKVNAVKIEDKENINQAIEGTYELGSNGNVEVKSGKVILRNIGNTYSNDKAKFSITFYLSVESGYIGDIVAQVSGDALRNNGSTESVVVAKSINPINVTPTTNYIVPGQTIELGDIVLTEQLNGNGYSSFEDDKTVVLGFSNNNNYLSVVGTPVVKTENGLTVKNVKTTNTNASGASLSFTIDNASSRNKSSKITISGVKVAVSNSIPQGSYDLVMGGTAVAGNSTAMIGSNNVASFDTDGIAVAKLQYGGKVQMKITVGDKIAVINGQNVEMKMAPFIEDGTTYMQVSDIVKATGKTCTFFDNRLEKASGWAENLFVTFGDRTFEKDSSTVQIVGQATPESMTDEQGKRVNMIIKNDYTCLPIRYFVEKVLGQKISWNGTDNTITVD